MKPVITPAATSRSEPAMATAVPTAAPVSVAAELQKLVALRGQGALTEEEFSRQKERVLG